MEKFKHVVILGGAGKMGRGIALVLLQAFGADSGFTLTLLDVNASMFPGVEAYLRSHMLKHPHGEATCEKVRYVTSLEECGPADLVFEAVIEDVELKADLLKKAAAALGPHPYFFSNTSSIPIHLLEKLTGLTGRIVGFHFYNPPPVQKLVELIIPKEAPETLKKFAEETVLKIQKNAVHSNDIAGFIGNGHFIREILAAWKVVERLAPKIGLCEAIVCVNMIYQDWLLRPMGIFQLVDYVGLDVGVSVMKIMRKYIPDESLQCVSLEKLFVAGIRGGQNADGSQKPGIFTYAEGKPTGVFSVEQHDYLPYAQQFLGVAPTEGMTWKSLIKDKDRREKLAAYFKKLSTEDSIGAKLALELQAQSRAIAAKLVETGVAHSLADVDTVLQQGFYHLG
jgi:3-hydroxyacyl-CoA dehydrogenase